ncbi:MAG: branched-chain amino acid aminotransferase [Clostridiales bacterium]|jgi:branched-chain amino acid aminotransferase|nr:branched-chain amino acid aminotransferase [Clostridiales bacterium]
MNLKIIKNSKPKEKPDFSDAKKLGFGKIFSDHMFVMDYLKNKGWHNARIVPYGKFEIEPSISVLHYGQSAWEGLKAYKTDDNNILLFRPEKNFERLNNSMNRLEIPKIDENFCLEALKKLILIDKEWVPNFPQTSLYIRPIAISTDTEIRLKSSENYKFLIICSPSGNYNDLAPNKIIVEEKYVRAAPGGTGFAKTPGNYAATLTSQKIANEKGYSQVLWLEAIERKYIEEVGSMNIFFKISGEIITPALNGSILPGITRMSVIEILKDWEIPVSERKISIEEIYKAYKNETLEECFGSGTAAVITSVGELSWQDKKIIVNENKIGSLTKKLYDEITGIQYGKIKDKFNWTMNIS